MGQITDRADGEIGPDPHEDPHGDPRDDPHGETAGAAESSENSPSQVLSRRELLKQVGIAGAAATILPIFPGSEFPRNEVSAQATARATEPAATLNAKESETLKAIVARIVPADENGPGALEARADRYIDRALGGALASSRALYTAGLAELDAYAQSSKGAAFAKLSASDQDAILADMQDNRATGFSHQPSQFFDLVRTHTIQGVFADPFYGGNANFIGWDLIGYPGARVVVTADEQRMDVKPKSNHKSAYDYGMFSKGVV
jgi:gluconate 2-dehydrogenase gamma chain